MIKKYTKIFWNGLTTGLILQLAVGPVFFYIMNLVIKKSLVDGLMGVVAVTLVDYLYITLSIWGVGRLLEYKKNRMFLGIVWPIILVVFWIVMVYNGTVTFLGQWTIHSMSNYISTSLRESFFSVVVLTLCNPMTIVFFTSLFSTKALEYQYRRQELWFFWFSVGIATLLFMSSATVFFSSIRGLLSISYIDILHILVWLILIGYGAVRIVKLLTTKTNDELW